MWEKIVLYGRRSRPGENNFWRYVRFEEDGKNRVEKQYHYYGFIGSKESVANDLINRGITTERAYEILNNLPHR